MTKKLQVINCFDACKMTRQMRSSNHCNKKASVVDGRVFFGCKESTKAESKEVKQFLSCDLWNMGLEDSCITCELECINNKNEKMKTILAEKKKLDDVITRLRPNMVLYGVSAEQVEGISSKYAKRGADGSRDKMGSEAIQAANFANNALKLILKGRSIDLAFFSLYAKKASGRIKKLKKN
jgi:hypothetical protein